MNSRVRLFGLLFSLVWLAGCTGLLETFDLGDADVVQVGDAEERALAQLQSVDPIGLHKVWKTSVARSPGEHMQHPGHMVVSGKDVFLGTFQGDVVRLNREDGRVLWESGAGGPVAGGVAVDGQRVFAGTREGEMLAFSQKDGHELWRVRVSTSVASAPVVAGDRLLFLTLDNRTHALNTEDGKRLWVHTTPPESLVLMGAAMPTVQDDRVYVGYASGEVFALSLEKGTSVWQEDLSVLGGRSELELLQDVDAAIVALRGAGAGVKKLFAVNHQGRVVALYPRSGAREWEQPFSSIRRPLVLHNRLFLSDMDGSLVAVSVEDGLRVWRTRLTKGLLTAPVAMGDRILVADTSGQLFVLDAGTGQVLGLDRLDETVWADPVVVDNSLFLWTHDGDLLRYDFEF